MDSLGGVIPKLNLFLKAHIVHKQEVVGSNPKQNFTKI